MDLTQLSYRLRDGRLFHSYIVTGADQQCRDEAAMMIAQAGVCTGQTPLCGVCRNCKKAQEGIHPDISHLRPEKGAKEITVDAMRAVRAAASVIPNEGTRSVYIIHQADTMNTGAQNAMLKVFEEPPDHALFVLVAENPERLLQTVRSRCQVIYLTPASREDAKESGQGADALLEALLSGSPLDIAKASVPLEKMSRVELSELLVNTRRQLIVKAGSISPDRLAHLAEILNKADKYLDANVSSGHVSGLIMAEAMGLDDNILTAGKARHAGEKNFD